MQLCKKYQKDFEKVKRWHDGYQIGDFIKIRTKSFQNDMISFKNKDDILTLLIQLGYLAFHQISETAYIPNEEIRSEFAEAIEEDCWNEFIQFQRQSDDLLGVILDMDEQAVANLIEKIHM